MVIVVIVVDEGREYLSCRCGVVCGFETTALVLFDDDGVFVDRQTANVEAGAGARLSQDKPHDLGLFTYLLGYPITKPLRAPFRLQF